MYRPLAPLPRDSVAGRSGKFAAAGGALLLQLLFITAFIYGVAKPPPLRPLVHELTFILPRLAPKPPITIDARSPSLSRSAAPLLTPPPLWSLQPLPPSAVAPPDAIRNFGQALFGCAPENYTNLTPQQRAQCPRPGEGLAIQEAPDPLGPRPRAKEEAYWQEQLRRVQLSYEICSASASLADCLFAQKFAEHQQEEDADYQLAKAKAAARKPPERPLPQHFGRAPASAKSVSIHPQ